MYRDENIGVPLLLVVIEEWIREAVTAWQDRGARAKQCCAREPYRSGREPCRFDEKNEMKHDRHSGV